MAQALNALLLGLPQPSLWPVRQMTPDEYLQGILTRERVDTGLYSPVRGVQQILLPHLQVWGNKFLLGVSPSGSFAKGTANKSGTDIDLFVSVSEEATETLKQVYETLFNRMQEIGAQPRRQNVSIGVKINGFDVDLVPGKRQNPFLSDYSLYRRRADTWTKTNVSGHISLVANSGRLNEIRVLKLWRNQRGLDFPSFHLELTVIEALRANATWSLSDNVWRVLIHLRDRFENARVVDPFNTNNLLSDELSQAARTAISSAAGAALKASDWSQIVK